MQGMRIAGLGQYLPARVLTNAELETMVDTSDQWIRERTGIRERRIAANEETAGTLAARAAQDALTDAGMAAEDLDLVLVGTTTPDGLFPSTASIVQDRIGARNAGAFDINAACVGFLSALATGMQFVQTGACRRVLVAGTEVLSRIVNWSDRNTCVLFGDGAGAIILEAAPYGGPLGLVLHSDGSHKQWLFAEGPCSARDAEGNGPPHELCYVNMDGPAIFKFAVQAMVGAVRGACARAGVQVSDVDLLVPHQANLRILQGTAKQLGIPEEKTIVTIDRYGNNSSATIPIALCEAQRAGRLHEGDKVALCSFGGGLAWGAILLEYSRTGERAAATAPQAVAAPG